MASDAEGKARRIEVGRQRRMRTRAKILAAAFAKFGAPNGLYTRIEDIATEAGITRPTFYNHFSGMDELRDALSYEVTHDFLTEVLEQVAVIPDPRERASLAVQRYLRRAVQDRAWCWSMINISANGMIFGAETFRAAEQTVREGIEDGVLGIDDLSLGRDLLLGTCLAAFTTIVNGKVKSDYPARVTTQILIGLGVEPELALEITKKYR